MVSGHSPCLLVFGQLLTGHCLLPCERTDGSLVGEPLLDPLEEFYNLVFIVLVLRDLKLDINGAPLARETASNDAELLAIAWIFRFGKRDLALLAANFDVAHLGFHDFQVTLIRPCTVLHPLLEAALKLLLLTLVFTYHSLICLGKR